MTMTDHPTTPTDEPPVEAYTPSPRRPSSTDRDPAAVGGLLGAVPSLRFPARLRDRLTDEIEAGRKAVQEAGRPVDSGKDEPSNLPANEQLVLHQRQLRLKALRECVPVDYEPALNGLAALDDDQHPAALAAWLDDSRARTLILAGPTGNGKTMAAYAVGAQATRYGATMARGDGTPDRRELLVREWSVNGYLAELRPDGSPEPVWQIRDRAQSAGLLILNDLGAELDAEASEHVRKELVQLLEVRLARRLRTVVTTNLKSAPLRVRLGDRLSSRLKQGATILEFRGPDRRDLNGLEW